RRGHLHALPDGHLHGLLHAHRWGEPLSRLLEKTVPPAEAAGDGSRLRRDGGRGLAGDRLAAARWRALAGRGATRALIGVAAWVGKTRWTSGRAPLARSSTTLG